MATLRHYRPGDLEDLYRICLLTGDSGADASPLHNDPELIGHVYAGPYGVLEPEHVLVAGDEGGIAGYLVGTHDTAAFEARLEREWWPDLRQRYAGRDEGAFTKADRMRLATINRPSSDPADLVARYPAHIHMNLLPRLRGQRIGSRLLQLWIDAAQAAGVQGIHLGANSENTGGVAFWTASGFTPIQTAGRTIWFGMSLQG